MTNSDPKLLADLAADDDSDQAFSDDLNGTDDVPATPLPSTARPAPTEVDDDEGFISEDEQRAAEGNVKLPSPEANRLSLDDMLAQLADAAKPARGRPQKRSADFVLPPAQRQAHIARIEHKLAETEQALAALKARRGDVDVLDDKALTKYLAELADAEARVAMVRAAHVTHTEAHARAEAEEARQAFEQHVRNTIANHAAPYAEALQELHFYTAQIVALSDILDEHRAAIEGVSYVAAERGRPELAVNTETLRNAVCRFFDNAAPKDAAMPQRWGETDEQWSKRLFVTLAAQAEGRIRGDDRDKRNLRQDRARIERARALYVEQQADEDAAAYSLRQLAHLAENLPCRQAHGESDSDHSARLLEMLAKTLRITRKGESDSAYVLRVGNAHAMAGDATDDVLDKTGQKAVPVIEAHTASSTTAERLRRQRGHQKLIKELDGWAGGDKVLPTSRMTVAPSPRPLPPSQPLPSWVSDIERSA